MALESEMFRVFALVIGYFMGNIQTAYIVAKKIKGIDIREHGSGNSGTTNITRVLGMKIGMCVFALDTFKAIAAFMLAVWLFGWQYGGVAGMYAGAGVVLGHNFPFHMRFRGGKGAASTIGLMLCTDWRIVLIQVALGMVCVASTRMVSVGSLALTAAFPLLLMLFGYTAEVVLIGVFLWLLAWFMHRTNIKCILAGNERKIGFGASKHRA